MRFRPARAAQAREKLGGGNGQWLAEDKEITIGGDRSQRHTGGGWPSGTRFDLGIVAPILALRPGSRAVVLQTPRTRLTTQLTAPSGDAVRRLSAPGLEVSFVKVHFKLEATGDEKSDTSRKCLYGITSKIGVQLFCAGVKCLAGLYKKEVD